MANKLKVQEQQAISNLTKLGWGIRKIARQLGLSRNTVRSYVRTLEASQTGPIAEEILRSSGLSSPGSGLQTDPLSTPGSAQEQNQTDPLSTAGNHGRKSLCVDHASVVVAKVQAGLIRSGGYEEK